MRKLSLNIILVAIFILVQAVAAFYFISDLRLRQAKKFEDSFRWTAAQDAYKEALRFNPLNAQNFAELGDFFLGHSSFNREKTSLFKKAEALYGYALELNPYWADYMLAQGQAQVELFLRDQEAYRDKLALALGNFKKALRNDPNSVNLSYLIGYYGVTVWSFLDDDYKNLVIDRLKYALKHHYWYSGDIYAHLWNTTKDFSLLERITPPASKNHRQLYLFIQKTGLWQFRRKEAEVIDLYLKKEDPAGFSKTARLKSKRIENMKEEALGLWKGHSREGKNVYEDGNMYWSGTIYSARDLPAGKVTVAVKAKGSAAYGAYPYMIVELDGEEIGETLVDSAEWMEYYFETETGGGIKVLSVTYDNDDYDSERNKDRNLYVGEVRIIKDEK